MSNKPAREKPLSGISVLDFGHYFAGPMVGMMLADYGADVIRVVKHGSLEVSEQQHRLLNRNKRLLSMDLKDEGDKERVKRLISDADVLIENFRPGVMARLGLNYDIVKQSNPSLIYLSLPGFSSSDEERSHLQAWEGILGAAVGLYTHTLATKNTLMYPPTYTAIPQCSMYGALYGAIAVMAALRFRIQEGVGIWLEVPLFDAGMSGFSSNVTAHSGGLRGTADPLSELPSVFKPFAYKKNDSNADSYQKISSAYYKHIKKSPLAGISRCKDGRKILMWAGETPSRFSSPFLKTLDIEHQLKEEGYIFKGAWTTQLSNNLTNIASASSQGLARFTYIAEKALLKRNIEEWEERLQGSDPTACAMVRTREEWCSLDINFDSGLLVTMDNGDCKLTVSGQAVTIGENRGMGNEVYDEPCYINTEKDNLAFEKGTFEERSYSPACPIKIAKGDLLDGLNVLDLSNIVAAPAAATTLAQFGAEVIKVESPNYTHPGLIFATLEVNQGKESIVADIKTAPGQALLRKLVKWSDVVIHNCLDDVAYRLGIDYDQLKKINPDIVSCQLSCFGGSKRGFWEHRKGFDPLAGAVTGMMVNHGTLEEPQVQLNMASADIIAGLGLAFGGLVGLYQQRTKGLAEEVRTSLTRMNCYYQLPYMISEEGNCDWGEARGMFAVGEFPWYRIYHCKDGAMFVACKREKATELIQLLTEAETIDEKHLEEVFLSNTVEHWCELLNTIGVASHSVRSVDDVCEGAIESVSNEEADLTVSGSMPMFQRDDHPCGSPIVVMAPTWVRVGEQGSYRRLAPSPRLGAHTYKVLFKLGYTEAEINDLLEGKVVSNFLPQIGTKDKYFFTG